MASPAQYKAESGRQQSESGVRSPPTGAFRGNILIDGITPIEKCTRATKLLPPFIHILHQVLCFAHEVFPFLFDMLSAGTVHYRAFG